MTPLLYSGHENHGQGNKLQRRISLAGKGSQNDQDFGGGAYSCHNANTLLLVSRVAAQTPNKSPPNVYSIAVMTKSSRKVGNLVTEQGQIPTIKSIMSR